MSWHRWRYIFSGEVERAMLYSIQEAMRRQCRQAGGGTTEGVARDAVETFKRKMETYTGADTRDDKIKRMVDRFLGWRLPENFNPDGGISFKRTFNDHMTPPMKNQPTGTNVFDAEQAAAMVRHMTEGLTL